MMGFILCIALVFEILRKLLHYDSDNLLKSYRRWDHHYGVGLSPRMNGYYVY
jgi:hypothetical protein